MLLGLATLGTSCRDFERLGLHLPPGLRRRLGLKKRGASDTNLYELASRLDPEGFRDVCFQLIRKDLETKAIRNDCFGLGVLTIDGKGCGGGRGAVEDPAARKNVCDSNGSACWDVYVLRACLVSAAERPILDQEFVASNQHESRAFPELWARMCATFGRLFSVVTLDAGFTSTAIAALIVESGKDFLIGLKKQHPKRFKQARAALAKQPVVAKTTDRAQGATHVRELRRATLPADFGFTGAVEVWAIRRTSTGPRKETEERLFLVSAGTAKLSDEQALKLVRLHWGIENGPNWTLDVMLREDLGSPCTKGKALSVISWLRVIAYNLLSVFRTHLTRKGKPPLSWSAAAELMRAAIIFADHVLGSPEECRSG